MSDEQQNVEKANIFVSSELIVLTERLRLKLEELKESRSKKTFIENDEEKV